MKSQGREKAREACETRSHQETEGIPTSRRLEEDTEEGGGRRPQGSNGRAVPIPRPKG